MGRKKKEEAKSQDIQTLLKQKVKEGKSSTRLDPNYEVDSDDEADFVPPKKREAKEARKTKERNQPREEASPVEKQIVPSS